MALALQCGREPVASGRYCAAESYDGRGCSAMTGSADCRPVALLSPAVGTRNVGDHLIEQAIRRLMGEDRVYHRFSIRRPLTATEIETINRSAGAILCGTNLYQHRWEAALTPETVARLRIPLVPFVVGS